MRNRAKCLKCQEIIEIIDNQGYVECKCKEIGVGPDLYCAARNWENFMRVQENDEEIKVKYDDKNHKNNENDPEPFTREEIVDMLKKKAEYFAKVPPQIPVTHYDISELMLLLASVLLVDCKS